MGNKSETIPFLDFRQIGLLSSEEMSEESKNIREKVREACESHGCFVFLCDEISKGVCGQMFKGMKALFDLPEETKQKHICQKPYRSYLSKCPVIPLCESFGIDDAPLQVQAFTDLMWSQGNQTFCETMKFVSSKLLELCVFFLKMIMEGYGLPQHYISDVENMTRTSNLRLMKYKVPPHENSEIALVPHTDKSTITILCQNDIQGLEVLTKTGKWVELKIPQNGFVVIVGDILKAWSNGRIHAAMHRVVMNGDKERYSLGLFAMPKDEMIIEVPHELVDDKMHPLLYKPFKYGEYFNYHASTLKEDALEAFAGV